MCVAESIRPSIRPRFEDIGPHMLEGGRRFAVDLGQQSGWSQAQHMLLNQSVIVFLFVNI